MPELVAWLAPVGLLQSMTSTVGTVYVAAGRTQTLFRLGLANTVVIVIAFVIGAQLGLVYVAIGYGIANIITGTQMAWLTGRLLDAGFGHLWAAIRAPLVSALLMAAGMALLEALVGPLGWSALVECLVIGAVGMAIYGGSLKMLFGQSLMPALAFIRSKA